MHLRPRPLIYHISLLVVISRVHFNYFTVDNLILAHHQKNQNPWTSYQLRFLASLPFSHS